MGFPECIHSTNIQASAAAATLGLRGYLTFVNSDTNSFCVSSGDEAGCLVTSAGSSYFQGEATLGLTFRF